MSRGDLGPVIDEQLRQEEDRDADTRQVLERGSAERVVAACVQVCFRTNLNCGPEPTLELDDALAVAVEVAAAEGVALQDCELVRTCMALCRVTPPKLTAETMAAFLALRNESA